MFDLWELLRDLFWTLMYGLALVVITAFLISSVFILTSHGAPLTASWYSEESCRREGTSGIMANGRRLNDEDFIAASWDYPFGTMLKITNLENGKMVRVEVSDRGPARRLYRQGRVLDLSVAAFSAIADLKKGIISISIERSK